jgi:hypothetical protein
VVESRENDPELVVRVRSPARTEPRTLSGEELAALVAAMADRYRTFVLVAAYPSPLLTWESLERTTGFEPATPTLARQYAAS